MMTVLAIATGAGLYEARQVSRLHGQVENLQSQQAPLAAQAEQLRRERDDSLAKLTALQQENEQLRQGAREMPKLKGEVARLNAESRELARSKAAATNDATESEMRSWLARVTQLKQRLAQTPESQIPELQLLKEQDWLNATQNKLDTEKDYRRALSQLRNIAEGKLAEEIRPALTQYAKENNGQFPTELSQLQPFFKSPVDDALLQRWEIAPADKVPNVRMGGDWIVTQRAAVDEEYDTCMVIGVGGYGSTNFKTAASDRDCIPDKNTLEPAYKAYLAANGGKEPTDPAQIAPYLTTPEQQAAFQRIQERLAKQKGGE
jgi:hypothetical protein